MSPPLSTLGDGLETRWATSSIRDAGRRIRMLRALDSMRERGEGVVLRILLFYMSLCHFYVSVGLDRCLYICYKFIRPSGGG